MNHPEPSQNCEEGKRLFEIWKQQPHTRFLGEDAGRIGPPWRAFTEHMSTCSLCDRRITKRAA